MTSNKNHQIILVLALLLSGVFLLPPAANAQTAITLETVEIRVWPEFDRPSVLVIYSGVVAGGVDEPLELQFSLPPSATLNAAAYLDVTTGQLLNAESEVTGQTLTLTTPNGSFHIEVYDPTIQVDGQQRAYSLAWESVYPVNRLSWEIQQPAGAGDLTLIPAPDEVGSDRFGLPTYFVNQTNVEAGQIATVVLEYSRQSTALTAEQLGLTDQGTGGGGEQNQLQPGGAARVGGWAWFVGGAALVVAAAAGAYFYLNRSARPRRARPARQPASKKFCTRCGKPVAPGDAFCRHCGAKLA